MAEHWLDDPSGNHLGVTSKKGCPFQLDLSVHRVPVISEKR